MLRARSESNEYVVDESFDDLRPEPRQELVVESRVGKPPGGRARGSKNVRPGMAAIWEAAFYSRAMGGQRGFERWAHKNPTEFYRLGVRLAPVALQLALNAPSAPVHFRISTPAKPWDILPADDADIKPEEPKEVDPLAFQYPFKR